MRKTSMTGDHPRQIRVIASSGAKLRAEDEEELMPFEGAMLMPTRPGTFQVENWRKARSVMDENVN
jgi:hypothetical protein